MEFDPIVALIITVIIGLLSYVYKMHYQTKADEIDFSKLAPSYDLALFSTEFPERDAYEAAKEGKMPETMEKESEDFDRLVTMISAASGDNPESVKRKTLVALLLKRAMVAVKRGTEIHKEIPNVAALEQSGNLKPEEALKVKAGIDAIQDEQKALVAEAETLKPSWGQHILPMAAQLGMSPEEKKAMMEARAKQMAAQAAANPAAAAAQAAAAKAGSPVPAQQMPVVNWSLFEDSYPERDAYNAAVKGQAPKNPTKEDEAFEKMVGAVSNSSGDTPEAAKRKMLTALLMKRAIAAVRRDLMMRASMSSIAQLDHAGMLLEADAIKARKAIQGIQEEQKMIVVEAESMRPGWGQAILPMAHELGVNLDQKKIARQSQSTPASPPQSKPSSPPTSAEKKPSSAKKSDKPTNEKPADEKASDKQSNVTVEAAADKPAADDEKIKADRPTPTKKKSQKA